MREFNFAYLKFWNPRNIIYLVLLLIGRVQADPTCPIKFGYFPDPTDCQRFPIYLPNLYSCQNSVYSYYICTFGSAKLRKCGGSLQYQHSKQICDTKAECQQEGGQANRPTYSGLSMKTDSGDPAPAQTSNIQQQPATQAPQPLPPTQSPSYSFQQTRAYPAAQDSQQDRYSGYNSNSQQQPQQPSQTQTKRPYDFFHAATTMTSASEDRPSPAQAIVNGLKPFKDPQFADKMKSQRPSFRPVAGRAPSPPVQQQQQNPNQNFSPSTTIQMAEPDNQAQDQQQQQQQPPPPIAPDSPKKRIPPSFRPVPGRPQPAKPISPPFQQPSVQISAQQPQGDSFTQPQTYSADEGQTQQTPQEEEWQPMKASVKYSGNFQGQNSVASDGWPAAPPVGQNLVNPPPKPNQNLNQPTPANRNSMPRPQNANLAPFMNSASQSNAQVPVQETALPNQRQQAGGYGAPPSLKSPVIPTDSAMSQCIPEKCQLPNCFCGGTSIPGGLSIQDTPQMVILSFDAEINERNLPIYEQIFNKNRKNPNGCNIKATFFVSHEFTNYGMVRYLYEKGHEIGSHSITHGVGNGFKNEKAWETEMSGQKGFLASFASIRPEDIKGARAPLLGPGGDEQFQALYNGEFIYDSTLVTPTSSKAPFWPYTLDFAMPHVCVTPPCPQRGYRGLWELPLNPVTGLYGENCYAFDRCTYGSTGSDVYKLLYSNFFDRHYSVNKAPFHLAIHADWLKYPPHREAFEKFLDVIGSMKDAWIVTGGQVVSWMKTPTPVSELNTFAPWQCSADDANRLPQCDTINACPLEFRNRLRYFYTCSACPAEFPWRPEI